ncbi:MAG: type II secretion system protein [bacterium]|nr:type II secretion system protein [bacterium]
MEHFKKGFTLAEVLITLAIIGVVAAVSIPSVISNSQQQEFKTGLRKAVSVLNSAITMNMALDGETPYDNSNTYGYFMRHMAIIKSTTNMGEYYVMSDYGGRYFNAAFYTTDGMRFEFRNDNIRVHAMPLYENRTISLCTSSAIDTAEQYNDTKACGGCGSYGLTNNTDGTTKPPCLISVDVNGDRKPNPANINCRDDGCARTNVYRYSDPLGIKLTDMFSIMITDKKAIPYGIAAQKAMYNSQR